MVPRPLRPIDNKRTSPGQRLLRGRAIRVGALRRRAGRGARATGLAAVIPDYERHFAYFASVEVADGLGCFGGGLVLGCGGASFLFAAFDGDVGDCAGAGEEFLEVAGCCVVGEAGDMD